MGSIFCRGQDNFDYSQERRKRQQSLKGRLIQVCERYARKARDSIYMRDSMQTDLYVQFLKSELCSQIIEYQTTPLQHKYKSRFTEMNVEWQKITLNQNMRQLEINELEEESFIRSYDDSNAPLSQLIINDLQKNDQNLFSLILNSHLSHMETIVNQLALNLPGLRCPSPEYLSNEVESNLKDFQHVNLLTNYCSASPITMTGTCSKSPISPLTITFNDYQNRNRIKMQNSFVQTTNYKVKHFYIIFKKTRIQVIRLLVHQIVALFTLLKVYIVYKYKNIIKKYLPRGLRDIESLSTILQQIIQQFLFCNGSIIKHMMTPLLERYYEDNNDKFTMVIEGDQIQKTDFKPKLNNSLLPNTFENNVFENSEAYRNIISKMCSVEEIPSPIISPCRAKSVLWQNRDSVENSNGFSLETKEFNVEKMMEVIQRSESLSKMNEMPYIQTFNVLEQIAREPRYYIKCKLIESLDQLITSIYMFQRPANQQQKCLDNITSEDNRLEILMFILYKFQQKHLGQLDLRRDFLNHIKFMMDFDEVLHNRIKNILNQSYIRFQSMLELIVQAQFAIRD